MESTASATKSVSVRVKLLLFVFACVFVIIAVQASITILNAQKQNEADEERDLLVHYYNYKDTIAVLKRASAAIASSFADRTDLKRLILAKDRHGVRGLLLPIFTELKTSLDITHLYIHEPNGLVFLRIHRPEDYGDAFITYRRTLQAAIEDGRTVAGVELDPNRLGVRGVSPVFYGGELIGLVECGLDYDQAFIEDLRARTGMDYKMWVTYEAAAPSGLWPRADEPKASSDRLFHYASTFPASLPIPKAIYERVLKNGSLETEFVSIGGERFAVLVGPLLGYEDRIIGVIEIVRSRSETLAALHRGQLMILLIAVGLALLGLTLLWFLTKTVVLRPLGHLVDVALQQFKGDLTARVNLLPRDEFGQLGHTFNILSGKLSDTLKEQGNTIAELRSTQEALLKSEEKFRELAELLPETIFEMDPHGRLTFVNHSAFTHFRYTQEDLDRGLNGFDMIAPSDREKAMKIAEKTMRGKNPGVTEYLALRKDGTTFPAMFRSTAIVREGKPAGLRGFVIDITETKRLESQLHHAQKMEAVGTLAGGVAHDFNNLLQAVQGYAELLLLGKKSDELGHRELQEIVHASRRGADLTKQLLTFSRKVGSSLRPVDLNQEVKSVKRLLERTIPKMIEIELRLANDLRVVNADPSQIEQVLMNLAVNAKDAMSDGGMLTIETSNATLDEDFRRKHAGVEPGNYVLIRVSDTGCGIGKETMEHVYEPFYTKKEPGKGTGLGLASVYGIVKNHGGFIACDSEPGQGTTFKIYLSAIEHTGELAENGEGKSALQGGTETILLVDDEQSIRSLGQRILGKFGYTVLCAVDGESALELYGAKEDSIDLVILDLIMPGMGGRKCLEQMMEIAPGAKVLVASGYSSDEEIRASLKAGAKGFVRKPFEIGQMLQHVRAVLNEN